jgi:hypothetical protein
VILDTSEAAGRHTEPLAYQATESYLLQARSAVLLIQVGKGETAGVVDVGREIEFVGVLKETEVLGAENATPEAMASEESTLEKTPV